MSKEEQHQAAAGCITGMAIIVAMLFAMFMMAAILDDSATERSRTVAIWVIILLPIVLIWGLWPVFRPPKKKDDEELGKDR